MCINLEGQRMKRAVLVLMVIACCISGVGMVGGSVSTAEAENTSNYININDYGNEVIALHQKLRELGYFSLRAESAWSARSADAVKILQENLGEAVTGEVRSKEDYDRYMNARGKNLLLGTNHGTKNYSIIDKGYNAIIESPDNESVKVTTTSKDDSGWLVLFFNDGRSKEILSRPAGEEYTLSFDARSNVENAGISASHRRSDWQENQIDFGSVRLGEPNVWSQYELHGKTNGTVATTQGLYLSLSGNPADTEIEIKDLKLERGSRTTEWCPAE